MCSVYWRKRIGISSSHWAHQSTFLNFFLIYRIIRAEPHSEKSRVFKRKETIKKHKHFTSISEKLRTMALSGMLQNMSAIAHNCGDKLLS